MPRAATVGWPSVLESRGFVLVMEDK